MTKGHHGSLHRADSQALHLGPWGGHRAEARVGRSEGRRNTIPWKRIPGSGARGQP